MPYTDPMGKSLGMSEYLGSNPQSRHRLFLAQASHGLLHVGVSKNRGTPKWMVYNGKPY